MKNHIFLNHSNLLKLSRELIERHTSIRFQAKGWSMRPFIQNGDFVTVSPVESSSLKIGDVVLYSTAEDSMVVHRIIKKHKKSRSEAFLVKGDASFGCPEQIGTQNVLGRVEAIERNGRKRVLDSMPYKILNYLLALISPFSRWIYTIGSRLKHKGHRTLGIVLEKLQSFGYYGLLAKKFRKENIHYKIAVPDDAPSLSSLYGYSRQSDSGNLGNAIYEQLINPEDSGYMIVARQKEKVVGGVTLARLEADDYPYDGWWLFGMKVNWRYRRMGIGEKLTEVASDVAAKHGASEIKLLVFEDAKPANNLYQKLGFRQISIPELDRQLEEEARENLRCRIILTKHIQS